MVTTGVAPATLVEAASRAPTITTKYPSLPRTTQNNLPIVSIGCQAIFERSSIMSMNTNNGTATRTSFSMIPIQREARLVRLTALKVPSDRPMGAKIRAVPVKGKSHLVPRQQHAGDAEEHEQR